MQYCDLVMKGGITSGIVYPNAVLALAKQFRFKSVGGTSAGAIAAAVTAAAALGDRRIANGHVAQHDAPGAGFTGLSEVSSQLSTAGFIRDLFRPARGARNAFRTLVCVAGNAPRWRKIAMLLVAVPATAPLEFAVILGGLLLIALSVAGHAGMWATALPSLFCAYAIAMVCALLRIARVVRGNLLGLCSGKEGLTDWLHAALQRLSVQPDGAPLTFADLAGAPRYAGEPATPDAIVLRMITTGVSHREPRTLPFRDVRFWFLRDEFDALFPREIVDWMIEHGGAAEHVGGRTYYPLPADDALPVLVATRMSLSFPLLISAVPLHEPARRQPPDAEVAAAPGAEVPGKTVADSTDQLATGGARTASAIASFRTCWFSDGGIASNFPIHLFDAALPLWPTFAIDLVYPRVDDSSVAHDDGVFLPERNAQGWQRTYQAIGGRSAAGEIAGFLFGIVATMQNWRDLLQARAPGQRDRIVHVALQGDEGGMNLDMPQDVLARIANKGTVAGERFNAFSFANHYWIRWRNLASALQRYTQQVARTAEHGMRVPDWADVYALPESPDSDPPSYAFSSYFQRVESSRLLEDLIRQGDAWSDMQPDLTEGAPRPLPQMTITPIW